jgi:hypothetical protein
MSGFTALANGAVAWGGTILGAPYFTTPSPFFFLFYENQFLLLISSYRHC